jgi:hypothetical protein
MHRPRSAASSHTNDRRSIGRFGHPQRRRAVITGERVYGASRAKLNGHGSGGRAVGFLGQFESSLSSDVRKSATQLPSSSV